jgi:putative redox protein
VIRNRTAVLRHDGGMRFEARTGSGRTLTFGDNQAVNEQSPVELLTTAVAACAGMDVVSILEKKRQPPEAYSIRVEAVQREIYPQVLTRIDVVHEVVGAGVRELAVRRAIELSALKYCPVNAMLCAGETRVHHRFTLRAAADADPIAEGEVVVTGPYRPPTPVPGEV